MNVPETPNDAPPAPPMKPRRWGRALALAVAALLLCFVAGLAWLTASERGFRQLWQLASYASGGALRVGAVQGTLWGNFALENLRWQQPKQKLEVSSLRVAWQPRALLDGKLQLSRLAVGSVLLDDRTPSSGQPLRAPASLALPVDVEVAQLSLDALTLGASGLLFQNVAGSYRYQQGFHTVALSQLVSPWGQGAGVLALGGVAPFALSGRVDVAGALDGRAVKASTDVGGSLLAPVLALKGQADGGVLISADARLAPFAPVVYQKVKALSVRMAGVNPARLLPGAPEARLALAIEAQPGAAGSIGGGLSLTNTDAGPLSAGRLPVSLAVATFAVDDTQLTVSDGFAEMAGGRVLLGGRFTPRDFDLALTLQQLKLAAISGAAPALTVSGTTRLAGPKLAPTLSLALDTGLARVDGRAVWQRGSDPALDISRLRVQSGGGTLDVGGRLGMGAEPTLALRGTLARFDPARLLPSLPAGSVNARLNVAAQLGHTPAGELSLMLDNSRLSGAPLTGRATARWQGARLSLLDAALLLGGNRIQASGAYGRPGDKLQLVLNADNLALLGPAFGGSANANLQLAGTPRQPLFEGRAQARALRLPGAIRVDTLDANGKLAASGASPFRLQLVAKGVQAGALGVEQLSLQGQGTRGQHAVTLGGAFRLDARPYTLNTQLRGGLSDTGLWRGTLQQLQLGGEPSLQLLQSLPLQVSADMVRLGGGRWRALDADWQLQETRWQRSQGWQSAGEVSALRLAALSPWLKLPLRETLVFNGGWSLAGNGGLPSGSVRVARVSGDVVLPLKGGATRALGLRDASASAQLANGRLALALRLDSALARADGTVSVRTLGGSFGEASPLEGALSLNVPSLAVAQPWLGVGRTLAGQAQTRLQLGGTLGSPSVSGPLGAQALAFSDRLAGVALQDGQLDAVFNGRELQIQRLSFGRDGALSASGVVGLVDNVPNADIAFRLNRFRAISRPGQRVIVSGDVKLVLAQRAVSLDGAIRVDRARVDFPKLGAPALSPDVVVVGRIRPDDDSDATLPFAMNLDLDLGQDFRFSGKGLTTALEGKLRLVAKPGASLAVYGVVNAVDGRFKAYGQDLDIEKGQITFSGAPDNPGLSIRALRRNSPVGAGVEVSGSVLYPKLNLVSDEPMSEKDRLAWLVLGRSAGGGGQDNAALAASAGSFLAGALNEQLGLFDDIGLSSTEEKTLANGTVSPAEQVVTLGRQLSQTLYLGYEYGITSASQAVKIVYRLSKNWSLQAKAGTTVDLESRYTVRFD